MDEFYFSPPFAFLIFLGVSAALVGVGRILAGPSYPSSLKSSLYAGGEDLPAPRGAPGYKPFFIIALFFAILHLGVLMLGTGGLTLFSGLYLIGLIVALIALILG